MLTVLTAFDCVDCADDCINRRVDDCVTVLALLTMLLTVFDCALCSWSWCNVAHFDYSIFFLTMLHSMLAVNVAYCAIIFFRSFLKLYADSMPCVNCVNCAVLWCLVARFALTVLTEFTVLTGLY